MRWFRALFVALFLTGFLAAGIPAASAHHSTSAYVKNSDNIRQFALVRSHTTGLLSWVGLGYGGQTFPGAWGVNVPLDTKIKYRSILTGAVYWTACGDYYASIGKTWQSSPYFPIPTDRPIEILDQVFGC